MLFGFSQSPLPYLLRKHKPHHLAHYLMCNITRQTLYLLPNHYFMTLIVELIGFTAAATGTSLMLPQIIKSIQTKRVDDISFGMLVLYFLNCLLWLIYGILILNWPVILSNFIALIISIIQLILKKKYNSR